MLLLLLTVGTSLVLGLMYGLLARRPRRVAAPPSHPRRKHLEEIELLDLDWRWP